MAATRDLVAERHDVRPLRSLLLPVKRSLFAVVRRVMPVRRDRCAARRRVLGVDRDLTLMPSVQSAAVGDVHGARQIVMVERCDVGTRRWPAVTARRPVYGERGRVASQICLLTTRRSDLADGRCDLGTGACDRADTELRSRGRELRSHVET